MSTNIEPNQRWLFPHERAAVRRSLERQEEHPNAYWRRLQQNYGPDGVALFAAAKAGQGYASGLILLGALLLIVSSASGSIAILGYSCLALAGLFSAIGLYRSAQGGTVGRRFRNGRPYVRRGETV